MAQMSDSFTYFRVNSSLRARVAAVDDVTTISSLLLAHPYQKLLTSDNEIAHEECGRPHIK